MIDSGHLTTKYPTRAQVAPAGYGQSVPECAYVTRTGWCHRCQMIGHRAKCELDGGVSNNRND